MAYTVLARRYRSQSFADVVGQDAVAQTLKNAIDSGRVAHAYLFCGTRGVGKTTLARVLAKSLNCLESDGPTTEPCCKCDSCVAVNLGEDIDVIEIDGASNNGVDNIRELRKNAIYRPARARNKIYIIDEIHMLSVGAFNALLKILEEPPEHVKFIFATTEPNKVLPTIQSRCQRFDFSSITPTVIAAQLSKILKEESIAFEEDLVLHLARLANGSMRDGLSLLDQLISAGQEPLTIELLEEFLGEPNREKIGNLLTNIGQSDAAAVLEGVDDLLKTGQTATQITDAIISSMRDMMVLKSAGPKSTLLLLTADEKKMMVSLAEHFDIPAIVYNITTLEKLRWTIKNSESPRALLEASFLRLTLSEHFVGVPALLSQIKSGQAQAVSAAPAFKKKTIVASNQAAPKRPAANANTAAPTTQQQNQQPPAAAPTATKVLGTRIDLDAIKSSWTQILEQVAIVNASTATFLTATEPVDYKNGALSIGIADQFKMSMCQDRASQIVPALSAAIGQSLKVDYRITEAKASQPAPVSPGARTSQSEKDEILSDPAVKILVSGLGANITDIKKM